MNDRLITALLAVLLALGGWTLSRTFSLSQDMVLIKEQVSNIEQDIKHNKKKLRKKKKKSNKTYALFDGEFISAPLLCNVFWM